MFNMNLFEKPCHIFLTGAKRIGKSTLIDAITKDTDLSWNGIKSITVEKNGNRYVYLSDAKTSEVNDKHLIAVCNASGIMVSYPQVFESYGLELLKKAKDVQMFIIDEIGIIENNAPMYRQELQTLLMRTDLHVLGTYRQDENAVMYNYLYSHDNVKTFVIKEANRDNMAVVVKRLIHNIVKN